MYRDLLSEQRSTIIGIDLGTTNSLVAIATDCSTRIIPSPEGKTSLPSALAIAADGNLVVGEAARALRIKHPETSVLSIKRFMGMNAAEASEHAGEVSYELESEGDVARVKLGERSLSAPEISALYLKELKRWAETDLGKSVKEAVITVPAYFNDAQRQATRDAARLAGLDALRIVNEPTAAALAYGLQQNQQGIVAVFDFGGGTFDVSVLELEDGVFQVMSTGGDTRLGGDDIDWAIAGELCKRSPLGVALSDLPKAQAQAFVAAAENAKIQLSRDTEITVIVELESGDWSTQLSRTEMETWAKPTVERTIAICREVIAASGILADALDEVLLVGGSSRMPLVQRKVREVFGKTPRFDIDPEQVVALGAAVQARILAGGLSNMVLMDVTPLSLGMETWGGGFDIVIPRNTPIPAKASASFTTNVDGQKNVKIHVLQGERELAEHNRSLADFVLKDLPPMRAGEARLEVTFNLDADGILHVSAKELVSGQEAKVEVQPKSGLSDAEVERLIADSFENAETDFQTRVLLDRRNDAEALVRSVALALKQSSEVIEAAYRSTIEAKRDALIAALGGTDPDAIKEAMEALNAATEELAEIQMNEFLKSQVSGKRLEEV